MTAWTRIQKITIWATLIYAIIFICMLVVRPGSRQFYDAFFNIYQVLAPLSAGMVGLIYFRYGKHGNRARRAGWLLIALSSLSFTIGQCTWTYLESLRGIEVPFPSWADAGYLATYFLMVAGGLMLFGSMPNVGRARRLLDSAIAASSMGILSWCFIVQRLWEQSSVSLIGKCISIAYPLGDIAALFGAVVLWPSARHNRVLRRSLYFLSAGIMGFTFFDTSFTWMSLNGTYRTGSWSDWTVSFGWLLVGYAFLSEMWWRGDERYNVDEACGVRRVRVRSLRRLIAPYIAVITACSIVVVHDLTHSGTIHISSVAAGVFLLVLVVIRQILSLVENRALSLELKAFNDNLEQIVAERTKELETQNRRILAVIEERNRFFRNVSHEVRTPLTSIIGFTELLMEDEGEPLSQWQKTQLQRVVDNAHRLLNVVNGVLDISKVESGRMEIHYSQANIDELVGLAVGNMVPLASAKGLNFKVDIADDLPMVTTDEQKLSQIIMNLLSNAVKYTYEGTVSISAVKNQETIHIAVKDTGVGIPQDEIDKIFEEFYRVMRGPVQPGTGLGLPIARNLASLLGGKIEVQSELGSGSTFTLTLPVIPRTCPTVDPAASSISDPVSVI